MKCAYRCNVINLYGSQVNYYFFGVDPFFDALQVEKFLSLTTVTKISGLIELLKKSIKTNYWNVFSMGLLTPEILVWNKTDILVYSLKSLRQFCCNLIYAEELKVLTDFGEFMFLNMCQFANGLGEYTLSLTENF